MTSLSRRPASLRTTAIAAGIVLAVLTLGSYVLGIDHLLSLGRTAVAAVLGIAFVKVWLVTHYFMDMRHAPRWLSIIVNGWILVSAGVVIGLYMGL